MKKRVRSHHILHAGASKGFTLIELLVVILVLGILAAIIIVSYNGMQTRARTAAVISAVRNYAMILENYNAVNGLMPHADWNCLGGSTGLPATNGYSAGYCFKPDAGAGDNPSSQTVEDAIATVTGHPPTPIIPEIQYNATTWYRGIIYDSESGSNNYNAVIEFFVPGANATCPIGVYVTTSTAYSWTRCDYRLSNHGP